MRKKYKFVALALAHIMLFQALFPGVAYCVTSGPSQPEYASFSQVNVEDLVDVATGDFKYSIPLMEVPGRGGSFPLVLNYNNSMSPETEASMVGLGWSLNLPAINRQVVGYPDDFNGGGVKTLQKRKPNINISARSGLDFELIGLNSSSTLNLDLGASIEYNNILGIGFSIGGSLNSRPKAGKSVASGGIGLNYGNLSGLSFTANYNLKKEENFFVNKISSAISSQITSALNGGYNNYLSELGLPSQNSSVTLGLVSSLQGGGELPVWGNVNANNGSSIRVSYIENNGVWADLKVLGSYYHDKSSVHNSDIQLDFFRFGGSPVADFSKYLSVPVVAKDKFSMTTGLSSDGFEVYFENPLVLKDREINDKNFSLFLNGQVDPGDLINVGISAGTEDGFLTSSAVMNNLTSEFNFKPLENNSGDIVLNKYFKLKSNSSEITQRREIELNNILSLPIKQFNSFARGSTIFSSSLKRENGSIVDVTDLRTERKKEASIITEFTNGDINVDTGILPFFDVKVSNSINQLDFEQNVKRDFGKDKLTGFINRDNTGNRYIYSLPVLNLEKWDVQFGVDCTEGDCNECSIYDNYTISENGTDVIEKNNYKNITRTFSYAENFLLTAIVGNDYVDVDPTDGLPNRKDKGYWIRFDYSTNTAVEPYIWRAPFYGANVEKNINGLNDDDVASFTAGKREQYYLQRVSTSTHYADFEFTERYDGKGAATLFQKNKNFGQSLYKLNSIKLYENEYDEVLKNVQFTYDYSLCPGVHNNVEMSGKLTLKELAINNLESNFIPPYEFEYNENNPSYNPYYTDGWSAQSMNECNNDFKYTPQINDDVDHWHLTKITLPSKSQIELDLSRDHYAYDEFLQAGQMFEIVQIGDEEDNLLLDVNGENVVRFKKDPSIPIEEYFKDLVVSKDENGDDQWQVFFDINIDLYSSVENIKGYGYVVDFEEVEDTPDEGYMIFKDQELNFNHTDIHPFIATGWQKLKNEYRRLKYDLISAQQIQNIPDINGPEAISLFAEVSNNMGNIFTSLIGHYNSCKAEAAATQLHSNSFVRLTNPSKKKFGGDLKVDKITYKDNNPNLPFYGKVYEYNQGVINCEPLSIKTESVHNEAVNIKKRKIYGFAFEDLYEEKPNLGSINKNPTIIYTNVKVKSLASDYMQRKFNNETIDLSEYNYPLSIDKVSCTGYTEYEHYTSKEFPTIVSNSQLDFVKPVHNIIPLILLNIYLKYRAFSQGYFCENNDMHGKLKRVSSYTQSKNGEMNNTPITEVINEYFIKPITINRGENEYSVNRLDFKVEDNGESRIFGRTVQNAIDLQIIKGANGLRKLAFNSDVTFKGIPAPIPTMWPYLDITLEKIGIASYYKSIDQKGILKQVKQKDFSNDVLLTFADRDPYKAEALTTVSTDQYSTSDNTSNSFSSTIPAYSFYNQLNSPNLNYKYKIAIQKSDIVEINDCLGKYFFETPNSLFQLGDLLLAKSESGSTYCQISNKLNDRFYLEFPFIDSFNSLEGQILLKVIDSGYSGQISLPHQQYSGVDFYSDIPLNQRLISSQITKYSPSSSILQAQCGLKVYPNKNLSPHATFVFNGARIYETEDNLKNSGLLESYTDDDALNIDFGFFDLNWINSNSIEFTNSDGIPMQSTSQDGIRTSILFGEKYQDPDRAETYPDILEYDQIVAKAVNAAYSEIVFEDFEVSAPKNSCFIQSNFDYKKENTKIVESYNVIESNDGEIVLDIDENDFHFNFPNSIYLLRGDDQNNLEYKVDFNSWVTNSNTDFPSNTKVALDFSDCLPFNPNLIYTKVIALYNKTDDGRYGNNNETIANEGHTGKQSLVLNNTDFDISNPNFIQDKEYYISTWLKNISNKNYVNIHNGIESIPLMPVTDEVEGWVKCEAKVLFKGQMTFIFQGETVLMDDVRIHPVNAEMETYVYDNLNRIEYILDNNNFYSQYHYDNNGNLIAISKETEEGKRTISETRYHVIND